MPRSRARPSCARTRSGVTADGKEWSGIQLAPTHQIRSPLTASSNDSP